MLTTSDLPWRLSFCPPPPAKKRKCPELLPLHLIVCTDVKLVVSRAIWLSHVAEGTAVDVHPLRPDLCIYSLYETCIVVPAPH